MNTAFLLAAGFGTRLRPLTSARPKPLLPVGGVAMLDHALAHVRAHGHDKVLVNAHHLWEQVAAWAEPHGVELQVELPEILGTGGGLRAALDRMEDRFVIVNGDILSDVDLTALMAAMPEGGASMALRPDPDADRIGPVEAGADGRVVRITSVVRSGEGQGGTHFTGIHAMSRAAVERVPADGLQCVVRTAYKELVPMGLVGAIRHEGAWFDVGTPAAYLQANMDVLHGRLQPPIDPWSIGDRGPGGSWIGSDAQIEGQIEGSWVGARSHVPKGCTLRGCVVWDGVQVPPGDHVNSVIFGPPAQPGMCHPGQVLGIGV